MLKQRHPPPWSRALKTCLFVQIRRARQVTDGRIDAAAEILENHGEKPTASRPAMKLKVGDQRCKMLLVVMMTVGGWGHEKGGAMRDVGRAALAKKSNLGCRLFTAGTK